MHQHVSVTGASAALHVSRPFAPTTAIAGAGVYGKHENAKLITATTQQHMYDNWDADKLFGCKCDSGRVQDMIAAL